MKLISKDKINQKKSFLVRKLATQEISPYVKKMDETSDMDPAVVNMLFENGVRY